MTPSSLDIRTPRAERGSLRALASAALLVVLAVGSGCGAARQESAAAPASPGRSKVSGGAATDVPASASPDAPAVAASVAPADGSSNGSSNGREAVNPSASSEDRSGASSDFERAARMMDTASSDCRQACRALASMDRACGQLCQLDADSTCEGDKTRLRSARKRVRSSCGSCPDGTSVEPDGPIPQPR